MSIRIITLEREYGCGAPNIAKRLSLSLGWKLWDRELTDEIARMAHVAPEAVQRCDEHTDTLMHRLAKTFWRGSGERSMPMVDSGVFDADCLVEMTEKVVTRLAQEGNCVIVGRGAPYFLRNRSDVFSVFLYADYDEKLRRLLKAGVDKKEAEELIESVDRDRATFIRQYFNSPWPLRELYNMMINTVIGDNAVTEIIQHAIALEQAKGEVIPMRKS